MISFLDGHSPSHCLAQEARNRLRQAPYGTLRHVSCESNEAGLLLLHGRLPTFFHKQVAQEMVLDLEGVTQVINRIEVL